MGVFTYQHNNQCGKLVEKFLKIENLWITIHFQISKQLQLLRKKAHHLYIFNKYTF